MLFLNESELLNISGGGAVYTFINSHTYAKITLWIYNKIRSWF